MAQPTITTLNFKWESGNDNATAIIDIPMALSNVNRKLYRCARRYAIAGIQIQGTASSRVQIGTAPDNWITNNAISKMFAAWKKQRAKSLIGTTGIVGKWADFKCYLHSNHMLANGITSLRPLAEFEGSDIYLGEWNRSQLVYEDFTDTNNNAQTSYIHILGEHLSDSNAAMDDFNPLTIKSLGCILSYQQSRGNYNPVEPTAEGFTNPNPYSALNPEAEVVEEVVEIVADENDVPPYHADNMMGASDMMSNAVYNSSIVPISSDTSLNHAPGFIAPMGLIQFTTDSLAFDYNIKVFLVPADNSHGVLSEAI
jgi:hypothetical protein